VQPNVICWDADFNLIKHYYPAKTVWVPSDLPPPPDPGPEKTVLWFVKTPAECVDQPRQDHIADWDAMFSVEIAVPGHEPSGGTNGFGSYFGWAFTKTYIRDNLDLIQDISDAQWNRYQAHHTLPQRFRAWFAERGFVIDDPVYLRWWCSKPGVAGNHPSMWRDYNRRWARFIEDHPKASRKQILSFRKLVQGVDKYRYVCPGDRIPPAPVPYYRTVSR
jgi:hypothetical protein